MPIPSQNPLEGFIYWKGFSRISELEKGDIIAWLQPDTITSSNTGLVMVAWGTPTFYAPTGNYLIEVVDSASFRHAGTDDRCKLSLCGEPNAKKGLGKGIIGIYLDENGSPVAYQWSGGKTYSSRKDTSIAFGRLITPP